MPDARPRILIAGEYTGPLREGIDADIVPFTETDRLPVARWGDAARTWAARREAPVIFTSGEAVRTLRGMPETRVAAWRLFTTGGPTAALAAEAFPAAAVAATAADGASLAEKILDAGVRDAAFFCARDRRPELPRKLAAAGVTLEEIVLYRTVARPVRLMHHYDAAVFFSPLAVESFLALNRLTDTTTFFAIGPTTAEALTRAGAGLVLTASEPEKKITVLRALDHVAAGHRSHHEK